MTEEDKTKKPYVLTMAMKLSVVGLLKLHAMCIDRGNDSILADEIRNTLDEPWRYLTDEEQEALRELSAHLNDFSDRFNLEAEDVNKRIAKKVLEKTLRSASRHTRDQCWKAILRLCGYTILPPTPDGWSLPCWMRQHGIDYDRITRYDDLPDGSSAVRSWGEPDLSDCRHPAGNGWCNPHLLSAAKIPPERLAVDHELRAMVMAGIIGP